MKEGGNLKEGRKGGIKNRRKEERIGRKKESNTICRVEKSEEVKRLME